MRAVPLHCDCKLNFFAAFLKKAAAALKVLGTCYNTKERLVDIKGTNLCGNYLFAI
jgi:hypothetical protein